MMMLEVLCILVKPLMPKTAEYRKGMLVSYQECGGCQEEDSTTGVTGVDIFRKTRSNVSAEYS